MEHVDLQPGACDMLSTIVETLKKLLREEDGPTAVEYAVMLMLIFLAVIATVQTIGSMLSDSLQNSGDAIEKAVNGNAASGS